MTKRASPRTPRRKPGIKPKMLPMTIMVTERQKSRLRELGRDKNKFIRAILDEQFPPEKTETI